MTDTTILVRPARDEDGDLVGQLIQLCWSEYEGCVFDRYGEMAWLDTISSDYEEKGGIAWCALSDDIVIGSVAVAPAGEVGGAWEVTKMYIHPNLRRAGLGSSLMSLAEEHAADRGAKRIVLWTDTRFEAAHSFYERLGYFKDGRTRELEDLSKSIEYFYSKTLGGEL